MKKAILSKVTDYILDFMTADELASYATKGDYRSLERLVDDGFFGCYYYQALDAMRERFGDDFDASRYYCKDGETLKYRHWTPYIRIMYRNFLVVAMWKMLKN